MIEDLILQQDRLQQQVDSLIPPSVNRLLVGAFRDWPAQVGLWYAGDVQRSTGNIYDASGQGRALTYNGNPTFNRLSGTGIAYCDYDGTGDFHSRADETDLDILGTETIYGSAVRGLAMAGWFWTDSLAATASLAGKYTTTGNQRSYLMQIATTGAVSTTISSDGTATTGTTSTNTTGVGEWFFAGANFTPSTSLNIWLGDNAGLIETANVTSIPASLFNSTAGFEISGHNAGAAALLTGRMAICILCANQVPDALWSSTFEKTRGLFGV